MVRTSVVVVALVALTSAVLPPAAWSQQSSGIAGVVRDTSGAVLPGVTVDAASPALIEQVRTSVTDGEGRYNIVELRPGTYVVTFSLAGFSTVRREGIELTSGFTATVNADLQVGGIEETITVTGVSPLVDTQNVRRQQVVSSDLLAALPTSTKHLNTLVTLTAGFTGLADVGGRYSSQIGGTFHGKSGTKVAFDGMGMENMQGVGNSSYQLNAAVVEEMVLQTSGIGAESNADGAVVNVIPKEGGNTFNFIANGLYTNDSLESNNLTDKLRARGLRTVNTTVNIFDEAASLGGPIQKDRLWFFLVMRTWGFSRQHAGVYWNKTQGTALTPPGAERVVVLFTPWVDRPLDRISGRWEWYDSSLGRLTWQASPRHKFNVTADTQVACNCGSASAASMQEAAVGYRFNPNRLYQVAWSSPLTSRVLLDAGAAATISHWHRFMYPGVEWNHVPIQDQGLGITYGQNPQFHGHPNDSDRYAQRFSISYVTGSHAFKTGVQIEQGVRNTYNLRAAGNVTYRFRDGVPNQITQFATPYLQQDRMAEVGLYVQDQWTIDRLTLNLGLRYDYFNGWVPAQQLPGTSKGWKAFPHANSWLPERSFAPVKGVPLWNDLNPRVGASYDLFGDGRTALKMSLGRYVRKTSVDLTIQNNPITTSVNQVNRSWNDANRNYVPDCDLGNFAANGECGLISDRNFGGLEITTRYADDVFRGWGVREFNWDFASEVQHQLGPGVSVTGGYYRSWYGNLFVTDNLAASAADFDPYCITAPADPRLPGGGGYQVCGLADINPTKFGQVNNLVTQASNFGTQTRVNDFFNVTVNARFRSGILFGGGVDSGRTVNDICFVVDSPQQLLNCRVVTPFKGQTQVKLHGSYPLPGDFAVAATYQNISGPAIEANYAATTAEIARSLGRNLAGGVRTATVPLVAPQTEFDGRIARLDLRLSKIVRIGPRLRLQANIDAYNVLNASSILTVNNTYGSRWRQPNSILDARIVEFGGQLTF